VAIDCDNPTKLSGPRTPILAFKASDGYVSEPDNLLGVLSFDELIIPKDHSPIIVIITIAKHFRYEHKHNHGDGAEDFYNNIIDISNLSLQSRVLNFLHAQSSTKVQLYYNIQESLNFPQTH
jgi:hypothetical protein